MSVRFNVTFSDDLNSAVDAVITEDETTKAEVIRKALQLYMAARSGQRTRGLKFGLVNPANNKLETEFVGL